ATGATCTITITFAPATAGTTPAQTFTVNYDDGSTTTAHVTGTASGTATPVAAISFSPSSWDFGTVAQGASVQKQLTLSNSTSVAATSLSFSGLSGVLSQTNDCSGTVSANGSCTVTVTYHNTGTGSVSQTLAVSYNNSAHTVTPGATIALTGSTPAPT